MAQILRREREPERWPAQGEREPVVERQCLERREPQSLRDPETVVFLPSLSGGSFC